jgi:hypothetical protein
MARRLKVGTSIAASCASLGRCIETRRHVYRDYDEGYSPRGRAYGVAPYHHYYEEPGVGFSFGFR